MNITGLQKKIFEMAIYVDDLCKKHNIIYYLIGGSALGAIRHSDFVPWDDDFDICMTYDNYMKFINICRASLNKNRFYLQEEGTKEWPLFHTKLRMNNTTYVEESTKNRKMHKGIFIDILCLDNVSDNQIYYFFQYISARLLVAATLGEKGYITKNILKKIIVFLSVIFIRGSIKKALFNFVKSFNHKETNKVGNLFGNFKFKNVCFPKIYLGNPRYIKFSTAMLPVAEKVEKLLTLQFGDYMKLPAMENRRSSHAIYINLDRTL